MLTFDPNEGEKIFSLVCLKWAQSGVRQWRLNASANFRKGRLMLGEHRQVPGGLSLINPACNFNFLFFLFSKVLPFISSVPIGKPLWMIHKSWPVQLIGEVSNNEYLNTELPNLTLARILKPNLRAYRPTFCQKTSISVGITNDSLHRAL